MIKLKLMILNNNAKLQNNVHQNYSVNLHDVVRAINDLKNGLSDGEDSLWSDNLIYDTHNVYVMLTLLFVMMLVHGIYSKSMLLGTMFPIPKNTNKSLCDSDNHLVVFLVKPLLGLFY